MIKWAFKHKIIITNVAVKAASFLSSSPVDILQVGIVLIQNVLHPGRANRGGRGWRPAAQPTRQHGVEVSSGGLSYVIWPNLVQGGE